MCCRGETIVSDYSYIPSVVFSSPHVAKVGLDEEDAVERYGDINIFSTTFRSAKLYLPIRQDLTRACAVGH